MQLIFENVTVAPKTSLMHRPLSLLGFANHRIGNDFVRIKLRISRSRIKEAEAKCSEQLRINTDDCWVSFPDH